MDKWIKRIDTLKERFELTSDAQAARLLGISQQALSQIRQGQTEMGPLTKLALLDRLGFTSLRDGLLEVLPTKKKAAVKKAMNTRTKKTIDKQS